MQQGETVGRWKLLSRFVEDGRAKWNCVCTCGVERIVREDGLLSKRSSSCGCLQKEIAAEHVVKHSRKHGMIKTRQYNIHAGMVSRCTSPSNPKYDRYSKLDHDKKWLTSFSDFWSDMGDSFFEGATLDRIDGTKGYSKDNCRWATDELQARNKLKSSANTSGETGVFWDVKAGITYAKVVFYEAGKQRTKSFSVKKYGLLESFALAVKYRKEQIERLNKLGYGYTDTHGQ